LLTEVNVVRREDKTPLIVEVSRGVDEIDVDAGPEELPVIKIELLVDSVQLIEIEVRGPTDVGVSENVELVELDVNAPPAVELTNGVDALEVETDPEELSAT
jgi:hypothetical protein